MVYVNIYPGDYFGDVDYVHLNHNTKRSFTVKALSNNCEVYVLNR